VIFVRLFGVTIAADLSFCNMCQMSVKRVSSGLLRRVRRSLDVESVKTIVHAFVVSRVDYCNSFFVSVPK